MRSFSFNRTGARFTALIARLRGDDDKWVDARMKQLVRLARVTLAFVFLAACFSGTAGAELLQRLHVLGFKVTSDTTHPRVGVPFHITLTVRVRERVTQLQYVSPPTFFGLESLGDQRRLTQLHSGGSIYQETLTLVARKPGPTAIGSAYLDAVDLRDSKTKRFFSNDLILRVMGVALPGARSTISALLLSLLGLLLFVAVAFAALVIIRLRRLAARVETARQTVVSPPRATIGVDDALAALRVRRDRPSVLCVREALWHIAGASDGETLDDVLQHEEVRSDGLSRILISIEHAAFIDDVHLQRAIDNALSADEHMLAR